VGGARQSACAGSDAKEIAPKNINIPRLRFMLRPPDAVFN
jgi:hypothetical protein